jgi:hypothetical protein
MDCTWLLALLRCCRTAIYRPICPLALDRSTDGGSRFAARPVAGSERADTLPHFDRPKMTAGSKDIRTSAFTSRPQRHRGSIKWNLVLGGKALSCASFRSVAGLKAHIQASVASYNETVRPFVWQKSQVHQKRLKPRSADQ